MRLLLKTKICSMSYPKNACIHITLLQSCFLYYSLHYPSQTHSSIPVRRQLARCAMEQCHMLLCAQPLMHIHSHEPSQLLPGRRKLAPESSACQRGGSLCSRPAKRCVQGI